MNYTNSPIREAIFDIKVDKINTNQIEALLAFKEYIKSDFPIEKKKESFTSVIQFSAEKSESQMQTNIIGYIFASEDQTRQLQVDFDGITLNILKPYKNWETHFEQFLKIWEIYNNTFAPENVLRLGTRYINRIEIPFPFTSFQEYISNMPPIPACLPQFFTSFFMQIQVPCEDNNQDKNAIISETIEPINNNILPFILDIDVYQELNLDKTTENITKIFNEFRKIKNNIFEDCITAKTKQLFL